MRTIKGNIEKDIERNANKTFLTSGLIILAVVGMVLLTGFGPCRPNLNPVIFVHGGSGSGGQFESQAMRFTSNGYPASYVAVLEYDSSAIDDILPDVHAALDDLIAELQLATGREQVDLLGHSLGTFVSQSYLATPERAANVAHYVNIDGRSADAPPGGVPTLALWAGAVDRPVQGEIVGAINVTIPNQEHVEVATSAESFFEIYHFFRGHAPVTTEILPQPPGQLRVSGRAVIFPQNVGVDGATLEIWRVDGDTGERIGQQPKKTYAIGPDGEFGPFAAVPGRHYEFALVREDAFDHHFFFEPFIRSDHLVRLNTSLPGQGIDPFVQRSENHTAMSVNRNKEFWGNKGVENDILAINGVDIISEEVAPCCAVGAAPAAIFAFDDGSDGVSTLGLIFPFGYVSFLSAADLFIPTDPPGTVSVETVPRGDFATARTVNVRNIPSTEARVTIQLNDFEQ